MMQNHKDYTAGRYIHVKLASYNCFYDLFFPIAIDAYSCTLNSPNYKFSVLILLAIGSHIGGGKGGAGGAMTPHFFTLI